MNEKKYCDTTIIVGPERKVFNVNRLFLAQASPVFEAVLYHCQKDKEIILENVACDVFESALRFCYCSDPNLTEKNVVDLVQFADKYQMDALFEWAKEWLSTSLDLNNFCVIFNDAVSMNQGHCLAICTKFIGKRVSDCNQLFESDGFYSMSSAAIRELIKLNEMAVCEMTLWGYLVKWARNGSAEMVNELADDEKAAKLRTVYDLVRFGLMTNGYFATQVVPESVLSTEEAFAVFMYINKGSVTCGPFTTAEGGMNLQVGQAVEVYNANQSKWCRGTIQAIDDNQDRVSVRYCYDIWYNYVQTEWFDVKVMPKVLRRIDS